VRVTVVPGIFGRLVLVAWRFVRVLVAVVRGTMIMAVVRVLLFVSGKDRCGQGNEQGHADC
jgi:hypothetical protein